MKKLVFATAIAMGLALAPAAFAQGMGSSTGDNKSDKMGKMDKMEKSDGMSKKKMKKGMSDKKDGMSDGMKKQ